MRESGNVGKIRWVDYCAIMSLLEDSEQKLAGLRSPRPREAREALQQTAEYLRDHVKWTGSKRTGHIILFPGICLVCVILSECEGSVTPKDGFLTAFGMTLPHYSPGKRITRGDFERFVWVLDYASGYLDNLLSAQSTVSRRQIEQRIKPSLDRITWQDEQTTVQCRRLRI